MNKHDGLAPVEFFEDRQKSWIAQPHRGGAVAIAGQKANAVRIEHVECILDLPQGAFGIGKWHYREQTKTSAMVSSEVSGVFVAQPRHAASSLRVSEPNSRQREREDRGCNVLSVHRIERFLRLPLKRSGRDFDLGSRQGSPGARNDDGRRSGEVLKPRRLERAPVQRE